jgi:hypothetical protein
MAKAAKAPGQPSRFTRWLKSFSGILSSFATIVAALATLFAAYQTAQVHRQHQTIQRQAAQIHHFEKQAKTAGPAPTPQVSTSTSGGATSGQDAFLSDLQQTSGDVNAQNESQVMSAKPYPNSVTFSCAGGSPDLAYDVAGHQVFTALVGIPDNAQDATGLDETVTFDNQAGTQLAKPVVVSLGSPDRVRINIAGVTQLEFSCTGVTGPGHQPDNGNQLTLGNAEIS